MAESQSEAVRIDLEGARRRLDEMMIGIPKGDADTVDLAAKGAKGAVEDYPETPNHIKYREAIEDREPNWAFKWLAEMIATAEGGDLDVEVDYSESAADTIRDKARALDH